MILLTPSPLHAGLFTMGAMDSPENEAGGGLWDNVHEACTFMWPFEDQYERAMAALKNYGNINVDAKVAEEQLKPIYQALRHGLSIDWVVNYVLGAIVKRYPFTKHFEFKHTQEFIDNHVRYPMFAQYISYLHERLDKLFDWVFEGWPDPTVFARMHDWSQNDSLARTLSMLETHPVDKPFIVPENAELSRIGYLTVLMEMLQQSVGFAKRQGWTTLFEEIEKGLDEVIVCGGKYAVFAFGRLNGKLDWYHMKNGVKTLGVPGRTTRKGVMRSFPDEMTFFKFADSTLWIDETHFPQISFNGNDWFSPADIATLNASAEMDKPMWLHVRYDLDGAAGRTVKVVGKQNCGIRDDKVTLDNNGYGKTQVIFRANEVSLKIADVEKKLPFGIFTTKAVRPTTDFEWLK